MKRVPIHLRDRYELSSGEVTWKLDGTIIYSPALSDNFGGWMHEQNLFASRTVEEFAPAMITHPPADRIVMISMDDRYDSSCTLSYCGAELKISVTIKGASHVPYGTRVELVELLIRKVRSHALDRLETTSPQEEFARFMDTPPNQPLATPTGRRSARWTERPPAG